MKRKGAARAALSEVIEDRVLELSVADEYKARAFEAIATGESQSLTALIPEWIRVEQSRGLALKTLDQMKSDVAPLAEAFRTGNLVDERTAFIWIKHVAEKRNLSGYSVRRIIGFCRSFFRYLESIKQVQPDAQKFFVIPPEYRKNNRRNASDSNRTNSWKPFEPEAVVSLHTKALVQKDQILADLILVGAYSGARIEELCSLKCTDINLKKRYFDISDSKTSAGIRGVPIHSKIYEKIKTLINASEDGYLFSGLSFNKYNDRSNAIGKRFGRLKAKSGYGKQHVFHSIRKTFVTQLADRGVTEKIAADIAGHEIKTMTYGLYSGVTSLETMRQAVELATYDFGPY